VDADADADADADVHEYEYDGLQDWSRGFRIRAFSTAASRSR
jgi:hypothetical protein